MVVAADPVAACAGARPSGLEEKGRATKTDREGGAPAEGAQQEHAGLVAYLAHRGLHRKQQRQVHSHRLAALGGTGPVAPLG